jgi:Tfp pilus assembly protein PilO
MYIIDEPTRRFGRLLHYAGLLATVLCAAVGYSLVHAPVVRSITATSAQIDDLMQSVQNAPVIREQHHNVSEKLREVTTRIANVQRRVPHDADDGVFLKEVTELAKAEQLTIKEFQPDNPENRNGYAEMRITLKGEGSFRSICTFVDRLSKLTRLSKIKDLTIEAGDNANEYPMSATLVIYFALSGKQAPLAQEGRRG